MFYKLVRRNQSYSPLMSVHSEIPRCIPSWSKGTYSARVTGSWRAPCPKGQGSMGAETLPVLPLAQHQLANCECGFVIRFIQHLLYEESQTG